MRNTPLWFKYIPIKDMLETVEDRQISNVFSKAQFSRYKFNYSPQQDNENEYTLDKQNDQLVIYPICVLHTTWTWN